MNRQTLPFALLASLAGLLLAVLLGPSTLLARPLPAPPASPQTPGHEVVVVTLSTPLQEVPEDIGAVPFFVALDRPRLYSPVIVEVEVRPQTATEYEDFVPAVVPVVFTLGEIVKPVALEIVDDRDPEDDETLEIRITSRTAGAVVADPIRIITILDDDSEATCTFSGVAHYPDGRYPLRGSATVDDVRGLLHLHGEDIRFSVDISGIAIGGETGTFETRGNDDLGWRYRVELVLDSNLDPGGVAEWEELTALEALESGRGLPERLAARRLEGRLHAVFVADSGSGAQRIEVGFDAGNGPYHCEGGLEVMKEGMKELQELFEEQR